MSTKGYIYRFITTITVFVMVIIQGCSNKSPIKVGFIAELTGKQSELGINLRNGVQLATEEINAAGGINGHPIELIIKDDLGTPQGARDAENWVIDQNVVAIIGHLTSNQTVEGFKVAQNRGVLLLSGTASTTVLSGKKDLFFRTEPSNEYFAIQFAQYIYNSKKIRNISIIYDLDNDTYSVPMVKAFSDAFTSLGGEISANVSFSGSKTSDFTESIKLLDDSNPDGIFIIASPLNTATIAQLIRLQGNSTDLFAAPWAQGQDLITNGGKAVEGLELINAYNTNDSNPKIQALKKSYKARFAEDPAFTAMMGYELMHVLAKALEKTDGKATGLSDAFLNIKEFEGLQGTIKMDEFGDSSRALFIMKVENHIFTQVEKIDPQ